MEKDAGEQDKEEEDSLLKTAVSVHNSLQQTEDRQKMTTSKPAEVKTEAKTVQEKKTKKKRKWGCLGFLAVPVPDRQIRQLWGEQIKKKGKNRCVIFSYRFLITYHLMSTYFCYICSASGVIFL